AGLRLDRAGVRGRFLGVPFKGDAKVVVALTEVTFERRETVTEPRTNRIQDHRLPGPVLPGDQRHHPRILSPLAQPPRRMLERGAVIELQRLDAYSRPVPRWPRSVVPDLDVVAVADQAVEAGADHREAVAQLVEEGHDVVADGALARLRRILRV